MNNSYPYVKLKELCDVNQGLQIPIEDRFTENAPNRYFYITVQFLKTSHTNKFYVENPPSSSICNEEDILIVRTGSTGQIVTGVSGCFHNNFFKVKFNKELIHGRYLYHCLNTKEKYRDMLRRAVVTTIPDLNHFMFLDMEIPLPEKNIQIQIAKNLDLLDSKIELNNRINAELEAMAKTLYDYWFVQFDFPDKNGKPHKTSGGKMIWNEELRREIPEGWEVDSIDSYAEVKKGELITAKDAKEGSIKVIAAGIDFSYLHSNPNRLKNTITISGSGANAGFSNFWREPIFASDCITVRGKSDSETLILLQYLNFIQPHILNQATGSAQPHVYPSDIKVLNYVIPPTLLIKNYGKLVLPMNEKIGTNLLENQKLTELRDWLLPMLMNGQVKVN